ncbi:hypothetical protein H9P43_000905 [Blastocladiella emersonii ATCC 22665]|nr:hypothetical protein H9P43_000905 [Blastocladiella emersonii ATCC 22665]
MASTSPTSPRPPAPSAPRPAGPSPRGAKVAATSAGAPAAAAAAAKPSPNPIRDGLAALKKAPAPTPVLFESQATAPAPAQTYYQVVVESSRVVLRDWPKLRYSQAIAKQAVHPSQVSVPVEEYVESDARDKVREIFGDATADKIDGLVRDLVKKARAAAAPAGASK